MAANVSLRDNGIETNTMPNSNQETCKFVERLSSIPIPLIVLVNQHSMVAHGAGRSLKVNSSLADRRKRMDRRAYGCDHGIWRP